MAALAILVYVRRPLVGRKVQIPAERTQRNEMVISRNTPKCSDFLEGLGALAAAGGEIFGVLV